MAVVIETTVGDITVDLFLQERPRACLNFLKLCKLKYYNYNLFHNIEHGFIAQTGDPTGVGDGGESVWGVVEGPLKRYFEAESLPKIKHSVPGLISMVSVGKNMIGSQFFFTLGEDLTSLDGIHCVIGEVTEGHDILRKLNEAIVDEKYRPYQDIRITHTVILEDPFEDPRGFQIPKRSPSPTLERLKNGRIGADEDIDDTEGKTAEEIHEMLQEREAKARATILEIVGDLPDAEIAPPENVLFVCKLNPVTTDDDLEIIFSRFGKVKSCEVIRDKLTGDSLQYAFVEFEDKKACENAFFKMDNVLIDDRRIHVDFSQSVAKVKWRGKGRGVVHADSSNGKLDFDNLRDNNKYSKQRRSNDDKDRWRNRNSSPRNRDKYNSYRDREYNNHSGQRYRDQRNRGERSYRERSPQEFRRSYRPVERDRHRSRSRSKDRYRTGGRSRTDDKSRIDDRNRTDNRSRAEDRSRTEERNRKVRNESPEERLNKNKKNHKERSLSREKQRKKKNKKRSTSSASSSSSERKKKKKSKKRKKHKKKSSSSSSSDSSD